MTVVDLVVAEPGWADEEFRRLIDQGRWTGVIELRRKDGSLVQVDVSSTKVDIGSGPAIYLAAIRDLSDRKRLIEERAELVRAEAEAQAQAEAARQRVRFVSDVSELLAVSLDYPATLVRLAELVVREIADLCLIDLVQESGTIERVAAVHASSSKQALAEQLFALRASTGEFAPGRPSLGDRRGPAVLRPFGRIVTGDHPGRGAPADPSGARYPVILVRPADRTRSHARRPQPVLHEPRHPLRRVGRATGRGDRPARGRPDRQRAALRGTGSHGQGVAEEPAASQPSLHPACRARSTLPAGGRGERGRRRLLRRLRLRRRELGGGGGRRLRQRTRGGRGHGTRSTHVACRCPFRTQAERVAPRVEPSAPRAERRGAVLHRLSSAPTAEPRSSPDHAVLCRSPSPLALAAGRAPVLGGGTGAAPRRAPRGLAGGLRRRPGSPAIPC